MSMTWSKAALRGHSAFAITESPRPAVPTAERATESGILQKAVVELERIGRSLYRMGLAQDGIGRDLAAAARRSPKLDFHELRRRLAEDYLPVMDSLERLARILGERVEVNPQLSDMLRPLAEGAEIIVEKGKIYLEAMGVEPIDALGEEFNPDLHEALEIQPAPPELHGKIIEEILRGYRLGDKLLRTSQVVVGRKN